VHKIGPKMELCGLGFWMSNYIFLHLLWNCPY